MLIQITAKNPFVYLISVQANMENVPLEKGRKQWGIYEGNNMSY